MDIDNNQRHGANQADIIVSIIKRLIDQIEDLDSQNCFLCDQAIPATHPGGRHCVTVSMGSGNFPHEFFHGGGADTLTEDASVVITPIVISNVDRTSQGIRKILGSKTDHRTPSLMHFKIAILKALLKDDWEPTKAVDEFIEVPLLRDMLSPLSCDDPHETVVGESPAIAMKLRFATPFDWDLTDA